MAKYFDFPHILSIFNIDPPKSSLLENCKGSKKPFLDLISRQEVVLEDFYQVFN